jgi:hypoxanthine-guanine phosphoribosyltransferase
VSAKQRSSYTAKRISARIDELDRQISRAYRGRRVDAVVTMDRGFVFAAGLLRQRYAISCGKKFATCGRAQEHGVRSFSVRARI